MHQLKLFVDQNHFKATDLVVKDLTAYDSDLAIIAPTFQVLMPGNDAYIVVTGFVQGTGIVLDSYKLGITAFGQPLQDLPDGIYILNYSVSPNISVNTELYHFRIAKLKQRILSSMSVIFNIDPVDIDPLGNVKLTKEQTLLNFTFMLMLSACQVADSGFAEEQAWVLYNKATAILDRMLKK